MKNNKPAGLPTTFRLRDASVFALPIALLFSAGTAHAQTSFLVNTAADTVDADPGDGNCADATDQCSLRAAVQEANAIGGSQSIELLPNIYSLTIMGSGEDDSATGDLDVTGNLTLFGQSSIIQAPSGDRVLDVQPGATLTLRNARIANGAPPETESGGGIRVGQGGTLNGALLDVSGNSVFGAGASGGGIFGDQATLNINNSTLSGNSASRAGGGIETNAGSVDLRNVQLLNNETGASPGNGGGLHVTGAGTVMIRNSEVRGNSAAQEGGGLWNGSGTMTVFHTNIAMNSGNGDESHDGGGGIFNNGGTLNIRGVSITNNTATGVSGSGGGIFNNGGSVLVTGGVIEGNSASRAGGGLESLDGSVELASTHMENNFAGSNPGNGGGVHLSGNANADVLFGSFVNNTAASEGGGLWNSVGTMTITGSLIDGNVANGTDANTGGGGLFNNGGTMNVRSAIISNNSAPNGSGSGGGILNDGGTLDVRRTRIVGNDAQRAGGGIEANAGGTNVLAVLLQGNTTGPSPGNGGGIHLTGGGSVVVRSSGIVENNADNEGGGLWNSVSGTMTVIDTTLERNTSPAGPDIFQDGPVNGGEFTVDGSVVPE